MIGFSSNLNPATNSGTNQPDKLVMKNTQVNKKTGAFLRGLRVRIKELAQEARFIRLEESRIKNNQKVAPWEYVYEDEKWFYKAPDKGSLDYWKLRTHRIESVRQAARAAQLAYAFLRGIPYRMVEQKRKEEKEWVFSTRILKELKRLVDKFGGCKCSDEVEGWLNETA